MSWRNEETKKVKAALNAAGINAKVGHGKGTAGGWLYIEVGEGLSWRSDCRSENETEPPFTAYCGQCPRCINHRAIVKEALEIAQKTTGRHGDYEGRINIFTQDETVLQPKFHASILSFRKTVAEKQAENLLVNFGLHLTNPKGQ